MIFVLKTKINHFGISFLTWKLLRSFWVRANNAQKNVEIRTINQYDQIYTLPNRIVKATFWKWNEKRCLFNEHAWCFFRRGWNLLILQVVCAAYAKQ
jgi:hypothetical protein